MSRDRSRLDVFWLGLTGFDQARQIQESLAAEIRASERPPTLVLLEHPHTYTFGRRGQEANLLWDRSELDRRGVEVRWTDRGGDVTYHGPGQLVGYPLLPLGPVSARGRLPQADYIGFIRRLEESLIQALAAMGLVCGQIEGLTGVWVQPDLASRCPNCPPQARRQPSKIAAIGIKVDAHGITRHGFSLNVKPQMEYWEGIIACGLVDHPAISLADLLEPAPKMDQVVRHVVEAFSTTFHFSETVWHDSRTLDRQSE